MGVFNASNSRAFSSWTRARMGYILVGMMLVVSCGRGRRHCENRVIVEASASPMRALFKAVMNSESDWR